MQNFYPLEMAMMKALSASTLDLDPYRAGVDLADALASIEPDVIFLFSSIEFHGATELLQAIYDTLGNENLIIIGCTGEGYLETRKVADVGACALGINFEGKASAALLTCPGNSLEIMERSLATLTDLLGRKPDLCYILADFRCDGTTIEKALQEYGVPAVGGFAGDNMLEMKCCSLFANRQVLENEIVILGLAGDFKWDIHLAHDMDSVGRSGLVTEAEGTRLIRVDQESARDFVETAIGWPISKADQGIVCLDVLDKNIPGKRYLRSIVTDSAGRDGSFSLFGRISPRSQVQVCIGEPENMVKEVYRVAAEAAQCGFNPTAGLIVSCAGRKNLLGNRIEHDVLAVRESLGDGISLAGFPSFGEFSPVSIQGEYSETFFHNMTYVLLLLGD
jgi:hypothetical protein